MTMMLRMRRITETYRPVFFPLYPLFRLNRSGRLRFCAVQCCVGVTALQGVVGNKIIGRCKAFLDQRTKQHV